MRTTTLTLTALSVLFAAFVAVSPAEGQKWLRRNKGDKNTRNENIPLRWTPTTELGSLDPIDLTGITSVGVALGELTDGRKEGEEIGRNIEDDEPKLVTTQDNVVEFVREHMSDLLYEFGLNVVESNPSYTLQGELRKFYCEEDSTYEGEIRMIMKLVDSGGNVVWESLITGSSTRWGRSYKDENYYETLADSIIEATHRIVASADFRRALKN